jgi:hypothetical protein
MLQAGPVAAVKNDVILHPALMEVHANVDNYSNRR